MINTLRFWIAPLVPMPSFYLVLRKFQPYFVRHQAIYVLRVLFSNITSLTCIRFVNTGVRLFTVTEDKQFRGYRLLQDGIHLADMFVGSRRRVYLDGNCDAHRNDLHVLLREEMPLVASMSPELQEKWEKMEMGPVLIEYRPASSRSASSDQEQQDNTSDVMLPRCPLAFAGWRGLKTLRHYLDRYERLHLMRLCGLDPLPPIRRAVVEPNDPPLVAVVSGKESQKLSTEAII
ncbi:unnamed protein product [Protopolystoma xenopodis]|uniref:RNA cytosine-C(5)-methyltransferase NSUN2-like PUA domain-containing protein n=1 Tax=Protopolystoma xenopodis TaxID=117903 RepID=A0A3S5ANX0_9PLAT|nr:unnamed protein product [Protopolystoma xenopodis]